MATRHPLADVLARHEGALLDGWVREQLAAPTLRRDRLPDDTLRAQSAEFLRQLRGALESGAAEDTSAESWAGVRDVLDRISRERATAGFTTSETATFVFSLKQPLFDVM